MRFVHSANSLRVGATWVAMVALIGCEDSASTVTDAGLDASLATADARVDAALSTSTSAAATSGSTSAAASSAVASSGPVPSEAGVTATASVVVPVDASADTGDSALADATLDAADAADASTELDGSVTLDADAAETGSDTAPPASSSAVQTDTCFDHFPAPFSPGVIDAAACEPAPIIPSTDAGTDGDASSTDASGDAATSAPAHCYPSCITDLEARCPVSDTCEKRLEGDVTSGCWEATGTRVVGSAIPDGSQAEVYKADGTLCYRTETLLDFTFYATTTWYDACGQVIAVGTFNGLFSLDVTCQGEPQSVPVDLFYDEACWGYDQGVPNPALCVSSGG